MFIDKDIDEIYEIVEDKFIGTEPSSLTKCDYELLIALIRKMMDRIEDYEELKGMRNQLHSLEEMLLDIQ